MANPVDHLQNQNDPSVYYSASYSPNLQGTEISEFWQLTSYSNLKIRGNIDLATVASGTVLTYFNTTKNSLPYNDTFAPQNFGKLIFSSSIVHTLGRAEQGPDTTVRSLNYFSNKNSTGALALTSSLRSYANIEKTDKLQTYIVHQIEQRDLGQFEDYNENEPYFEPDLIEKNPALLLSEIPESIIVPTSYVLASSPFSMDGIIEPLTIRSVVDRSSIDLPYVAKSVKGSLSVTNEKNQSILVEDEIDLRQINTVVPFLDSVESFANIDLPGAFSDAPDNLKFFLDSTSPEQSFSSKKLDGQIRNLFLSGVISSSIKIEAPDIDYLPEYIVVMRHGFTFSQNDNYGYDSIAFGGLKK